MWNEHLGRDVGEFWIRTEKYLTFHLQGTEYPPFAMLYFLLLRWVEFTFHVGFEKNFVAANYVLLGLHLAVLNQVAGRRAALLFGVLMLAAGSIVVFRYELLVSFLTLVAWCAWRYNWPRCAGALLAAAILSKLYPLLLVPLFARPPQGGDVTSPSYRGWQWAGAWARWYSVDLLVGRRPDLEFLRRGPLPREQAGRPGEHAGYPGHGL